MANDIRFSPRYDEFAILTEMADHLLQTITSATGQGVHGIPGLRPLEAANNGEYLKFLHLPTQAILSFRHFDYFAPNQRAPERFFDSHWRSVNRSCEMTERERSRWNDVPVLHPDAERLLAGLISRLWTRSKTERWAVSALTRDAFDRKDFTGSGDDYRYLDGRGTTLHLRWGGMFAVPAVDVAHCLTHPRIGIAGAQAVCHTDNTAEVRLGEACLMLERRQFPWDLVQHFTQGRYVRAK
ncbi:hypothetical protein [Allokutzneria sp. NRRL B-24872]|uniref:hypothetical protein n=1 Tax=Allokutzneria sp. NRRL B-24872 TaxID=1137961 RepID=UPI0011776DF3|nr:hypothetical protein [Allokutzneria sp. NRRL B-24872]